MSFLARFRPDAFTPALLTTVLLATFLPSQGAAASLVGSGANLAIALLFFLHGAKLPREAIAAGLAHWRLHATVLAASFVVFPLIGLAAQPLLVRLLGSSLALGILFLCTLSSTVQSSIAFTSIASGNVPAAIVSASASNILGTFVTPLLVGVLARVHGGGFSLGTAEGILLQLLLPFLAGQLLHGRIGPWLARHGTLIGFVDRGSILLVVYVAFGAAAVDGLWRQLSLDRLALLAGIDGALLALVLVLTVAGSRLLGFSRADEITIVFCGSKKSMVSGIPLASLLFPAHLVGMIVLPVMLFHQIQLMTCAMLARRYAAHAAALRRCRDSGFAGAA